MFAVTPLFAATCYGSMWRRAMFEFAGLVAVVYVLLCAYVYARQRTFIYYPTPAVAASIGEAVPLSGPGAGLRLILIKRPGTSTVIYFRGEGPTGAAQAGGFTRGGPGRPWGFGDLR